MGLGRWGGDRSDGSAEAHTVVGAVIDRVVLPQEDITKDPQGLSVLRGQVCGADAHHAVLVAVLVVLRGRIHMRHTRTRTRITQNQWWRITQVSIFTQVLYESTNLKYFPYYFPYLN